MKVKIALITAILVVQGGFMLAQAQEQVCVPQFVNGTLGPFRWQTTLVVQNQDQTQAQVRLHFYNSDGQPMNGLSLQERAGKGHQGMTGPGGQFDARPMAGQSTRSYRSDREGPFQAGYCVVESQNRIRAHAVLQLFDSDGNLISETGIIPQQRFRFGSFFVDQTEGKGTGLALMNSSPDVTATCTLELYREEDDSLLGTVDVQVGPQSQIARFLSELFPELLDGEVGYVRISCDNEVCGLALQLRGLEMLQIPIFVE